MKRFWIIRFVCISKCTSWKSLKLCFIIHQNMILGNSPILWIDFPWLDAIGIRSRSLDAIPLLQSYPCKHGNKWWILQSKSRLNAMPVGFQFTNAMSVNHVDRYWLWVSLRLITLFLCVQLATIRRCGHSDCFFFMEVGRQAATGAGELWMQVEDTVIAQNIHEAALK